MLKNGRRPYANLHLELIIAMSWPCPESWQVTCMPMQHHNLATVTGKEQACASRPCSATPTSPHNNMLYSRQGVLIAAGLWSLIINCLGTANCCDNIRQGESKAGGAVRVEEPPLLSCAYMLHRLKMVKQNQHACRGSATQTPNMVYYQTYCKGWAALPFVMHFITQ